MIWLVDTNVLLRLTQVSGVQHFEAKNAIDKLLADGVEICILLQNVSEFWNVCTRPPNANGLGFSIAQADIELKKIEVVFDLLLDTEEVYQNFRDLIVAHSVRGVKVHDAKIVAAMKTHNIQNLLTFNTKDFRRYTGINAIEPRDI